MVGRYYHNWYPGILGVRLALSGPSKFVTLQFVTEAYINIFVVDLLFLKPYTILNG